MELDQLKSEWNKAETPVKTNEQLKAMLSESKHPVLKEIRRQIIIEVTGWTAFLLCYYTMFDGHQKPLFINLILVGALLCALIHNLSGYSFSRHLIDGGNIRTALEHYLSRIKNYALVSVLTRLLFMAGFITFFTYNIQFNTFKYAMLGVFGLIIIGQLIWLSRVWSGRLKKLQLVLGGL
ncbi:MAG TPA: hypothetical protein VKB19_14790 [Pedobacter sp.]|nr:hypothetical protein [Pedobacter sp.]